MINSLYLHVPFCLNICSYCDFCHLIYREDKVDKWLLELKEEINSKNINKNLKTIYIGGGTPSSLNINQLETLLKYLYPYSLNTIEYTIEVNPDNFDFEKAKLLKKYNINRVSIGLQATQNNLLELMNRKHNFSDVKRCVEILNSIGIDNISIDLMYGIPTQSLKDLYESLDEIVKLCIKHVSIYKLEIHKNTLFNKLNYKEVDDDLDYKMYKLINKKLRENGFIQYEISNYCKDDYKSKHNLTYWNYEDFYGLSIGASGKENNVRYTNTFNINEYFKHNYIKEKLILSEEDMIFEYIMMNLRKKNGFLISDINKKYKINILEKKEKVIGGLVNKELIRVYRGRIMCTSRGFLLLNDVLQAFLS